MNRAEAAKIYKKVADKGNIKVMVLYTNMLLAADAGNISSMFNYARMLYYGDLVDVNKDEAIKYLKLAA